MARLLLYDHVRFVLYDLVYFVDDGSDMIVYNHIFIVVAVLVRFVLYDIVESYDQIV